MINHQIKNFIITCLLLLLISPARAETQVFFSPFGGCQTAIVSAISQAQAKIDIAMFTFTSRPIAQELIKAKDRGVQIRILLDKGQQSQKFSKSRFLRQKGFGVKFDPGSGLMHHKFAVIDDSQVITGSYNWTTAAENKNQENLLIIDDLELAGKYTERFELLWSKGKSSVPLTGKSLDD